MKVSRIGQNSQIGACTILPLWLLPVLKTEPLSSAATQHNPIGESSFTMGVGQEWDQL